ncbi:MAG: hypothetical protein Q8T13_11180 [Acidobacteriota bacterium]|nr:hypothetical protein [Acidobacteriota bacterium]
MELFQILRHASIVGLLSMLVSVLPLGAGLAYALWPSESRLAMMRPVSLAGLFSALCGTVLGVINVLRGIWMAEGAVDWRIVAIGSAESLTHLFLAFGCLTVAWLCVAAGLRRAAD